MLAKLTNREIIADNTLTTTFTLNETVDFLPGQYVVVALIDPPYHDDKGSERFFSINNPPSKNREITITTRLSESAFKKSLNEIPLETEVDLRHCEQ